MVRSKQHRQRSAVGRRGLAKILKAPGDLAAEDRDAIGDYLATRFAAAVV